MTGFGKASSPGKSSPSWTVECSSLNRKQLELQFVAPRPLLAFEMEARRVVASCFHRGRISINVQQVIAGGPSATMISRDTARLAAADLLALQEELGLAEPLTLSVLLRHPVFSRTEVPGQDGDAVWETFEPVLVEALEALASARCREGEKLEHELRRLHGELARVVREIATRAPGVPLRHRENLLARIARADLEKLPDEGRLAAEVALFADRCDITEEIARLESHLAHFRETMAASGPMGRTLEFVVQELFREINTTGSKASDPSISRLVVEGKTLLDQIREQLANVE